eukprot:1699757-Pyramimonas_sp.AAC.1
MSISLLRETNVIEDHNARRHSTVPVPMYTTPKRTSHLAPIVQVQTLQTRSGAGDRHANCHEGWVQILAGGTGRYHD